MTSKLKDSAIKAAGKHYAAYRLSRLGYTLGMTDSNMFVDMVAMDTETEVDAVAVTVVTACRALRDDGDRVWPLTAAGIGWARKSLAGGIVADRDLYLAFVDLGPDTEQAEAFVMAADAVLEELDGGASEFRLRADAAPIHREAWKAMFGTGEKKTRKQRRQDTGDTREEMRNG